MTIYSRHSRKTLLRTKVRGNFNIHGTKYFQYAVFLQKSKIHDVVSLLNLWWAKKTCYYWKHLKKGFSVITGCVNISCREQVFLAHQRFIRLTTSWIFDFWRKTAYWKYLVPWMLKSPLTSVLKHFSLSQIFVITL